jgi:hypothetical protein
MREILNLIPNLTIAQRKALEHELFVAEQVCQSESRYPGAPMADIQDQRRVADALSTVVRLLNERLACFPTNEELAGYYGSSI